MPAGRQRQRAPLLLLLLAAQATEHLGHFQMGFFCALAAVIW
jgi:hypothetical protein